MDVPGTGRSPGIGEKPLKNRMTGKGMDFLSGFQHHIDKINGELRSSLDVSLSLVREMGGHSLLGDGKRLRPLLFVLASNLCRYPGEDVYRVSTVFEYVHVASLLHDDVLDDADIRRKKPSAKNVWGNSAAVLGGDYFYSRAAAIVIEKHKQLLKAINDATLRMVEGQISELMHTHDWHLDRDGYMDIIVAKTAELISAACASGAIIADAGEEKAGHLARFGLNLGIAFQLMDDILDYTSSEETFGKPVGKDLKEGKITLPLIYALADRDPAEIDSLQEKFKDQGTDDAALKNLITMVRESGAIERILSEAKGFAGQAAGCLDSFPDSPSKDDLKALNTYLVERHY